MNVIISNKYKEEIARLGIDISKKLEGEYEVDEIIDTFSNYFFNKMIIDITAIKNYEEFSNLQKLSMNLNAEKIIFLLDRENIKREFLSQLVNVGIYNFTTTIEGIKYLYNNPNTYGDVVQYQNYQTAEIEKEEVKEDKKEEKEHRSIFMPNINKNKSKKIIGIKNVTNSAGSTTLTYIIKKELSNYKDVVAIEINKKDFIFLRDPELISVEAREIDRELMKHSEEDIILIDLNSYNDTSMCTDVLYLIEPTTIKLNKLVMLDRKIFEKLNGKKIILNKSLLSKKEISSFEFETASKVFYNIPPLDEKISNAELLLPLLERLNLLN